VSRGGRPDLGAAALGRVRAPTLLIVGGADHGVIELNEEAYRQLTSQKRLEIVPGATHLFEEPGALEKVVAVAAHWFELYLVQPFKYESRG
jgi:pimeloyl-ACP methyl ester carboxylesterase